MSSRALSEPAGVRAEGSVPSSNADPAASPGTVLRARQLSKTFGARHCLRAVDLTVSSGERIAVLGANGAGKSTLIRLLALLLRPTSGRLEIAGRDPRTDASQIRRLLGVAFDESLLYPDLTVAENLHFTARLYGVDGARERVASLLDRFALTRIGQNRVRQLSRGQRQRVSVARALVNDPCLVLLDEPDTALDSAAFELLRSELCADGSRTVIFTSHDTGHALALASRLVLLDGGRANDLGPAAAWTASTLAETQLRSTTADGFR
jgi:ABC-type multidrug transport system ATPase subunit